MMQQEHDLPEDVITAIRANRKIDAIKLLRESAGIGLKEAKHAVEAWQRAHQHLVPPAPESPSGISLVALVLLVVLIAYGAYRVLG